MCSLAPLAPTSCYTRYPPHDLVYSAVSVQSGLLLMPLAILPPLVYSKILLINHTLEQLCPHFHSERYRVELQPSPGTKFLGL